MKKIIIALALVLAVSLYLIVFYVKENNALQGINSFESCLENGYPVMESYPRQCALPDGRSFTEEVKEEAPAEVDIESIDNKIKVTSPKAGETITSPLKIEGSARGMWFFEASFPARLFDANGVEIAVIPVTAKTDWMTEEFVDFYAELVFTNVTTATGTLILQKDNPSGLPEHDGSISIPVKF